MNPRDRWFYGIARNLIWLAARKAPPAWAERLAEEWLADLTARSGAFSQLRFALGCCWATTVIAHEFGAPVRPVAAAVAGSRTTVLDPADPGPSFSRRTTVILLIVGLHVLVICVLATGIGSPKVFKANPPRIEVSFLPKPAPPVPQIPVHPTLSQLKVHHPTPPEPTMPTEQTVTTQEEVTEAPPVQPADPPMPKPVNRVLGGPGVGFPNTDDFYPEASRRLGEKGIATVNVCVDGSGRVIGKPTIDQSSGSARLDEGALRLANAGSGHYRATTDDGHPVSACYPFRVRFQLRDY
jgi:TonB family protein